MIFTETPITKYSYLEWNQNNNKSVELAEIKKQDLENNGYKLVYIGDCILTYIRKEMIREEMQ